MSQRFAEVPEQIGIEGPVAVGYVDGREEDAFPEVLADIGLPAFGRLLRQEARAVELAADVPN